MAAAAALGARPGALRHLRGAGGVAQGALGAARLGHLARPGGAGDPAPGCDARRAKAPGAYLRAAQWWKNMEDVYIIQYGYIKLI